MGTLSSSTETPTTSGVKNVETCKAVTLRSGKEIEESTEKEKSTELPPLDSSDAEKQIEEEPSSPGYKKKKEGDNTANLSPQETNNVMADINLKTPKFVQERPPPPFPQRIKKAKEEQQFGKFMEILKQFHINIPLIEAIQQMPNYSKFMKDALTKRKRVGEFSMVAHPKV